ncbi:nuclear pore complex protein [Ditylenchus destructor]|uniref:Nuclear pore complex protein n=1 Tax=Ditylenchus destructor TaxID=166010 RepID=A0AAD4QYY0_9BILA|nr:nuclear pore complex protein [Ditylenchus destructor]
MDPNVSRYIQLDRDRNDLFYKLKGDENDRMHRRIPTSGMAEGDYQSADVFGVPTFPRAWHHNFPMELREQFKHIQSNFATGLLPQISRAWMAVDSDLFLWNFEMNRDLAFYDGISNTILMVDLARPKAAFRKPDIHYFLIVVTTVDILLLSISFRDESHKLLDSAFTDFKNADAYLLAEPLFRLPLDGAIVSCIRCTLDGRIFYAESDNVWELEYYEKTWLSSSYCKKTNHSKGIIDYVVPVLSLFHSKDTIRQLELDDSKHILYVLFNKGSIQVFDLGNDGTTTSKIFSISREQIEVAVTAKGIRIYFTCLSNEIYPESQIQLTQQNLRPLGLKMVHIRIPSTDPASSLTHNVYAAYSSKEAFFMSTGGQDVRTSLHSMTSSNFPWILSFNEHIATLPIKGNIWAISTHSSTRSNSGSQFLPNITLPLITRQHRVRHVPFYVLTSEGIFTYHLLSPVEIFKQIVSKYGTESKQFQTFCRYFEPIEVCGFALNVICGSTVSDNSTKDVALRILSVQGGRPQIQSSGSRTDAHQSMIVKGMLHSPQGNTTLGNISALQSPLRTSTPQGDAKSPLQNREAVLATPPGYDDRESFISSGVHINPSALHDALYMYFSRLVNRIWERNICYLREGKIYTSLAEDEVAEVAGHVGAFKQALEHYSLISPSTLHYTIPGAGRNPIADSYNISALDQERQSLLKLQTTVTLSFEILQLWTILLDHKFEVIASAFSANMQQSLINWTLEDLVINRENVCSELITGLIRYYVGDDATTVAITNRLRASCPTIFTSDDALVAIDDLYRAKNSTSSGEKQELVKKAVSVMMGSIQKLDLAQICDLLLQALQFQSIVDLVLARAERDDANKLALIAYHKHTATSSASTDSINDAMRKRTESYNCITEILQLLRVVATSNIQPVAAATLNAATYLFESAEYVKKLSPSTAVLEIQNVVNRVFESEDELAHVAVFRWLLSHGLEDIIVKSRCKYFESFLFHEIETHQDMSGRAHKYLELLWRYYEKNENYVEAAKILTDMASKVGSKAALDQRVTYLSHALMCIQSAPETNANLEMKQDIQDKLDVAQIQVKTKNLLDSKSNPRQYQKAIEELNRQLFNLTELYDQYANAFDLPEIKLDVLFTAGHFEKQVVETIWSSILTKELDGLANGVESEEESQRKLGALLSKARKHYANAPQFAAHDFIIRELLMFGFKTSLSSNWLPAVCKTAEIPLSTLLSVTSYQYRAGDPFWKQNQRGFEYLVGLAITVAEIFKAEKGNLYSNERKIMREACLNFIAALQLDTHFGSSNQQNSRKLEVLQAEIERIR